MRKIVRSLAGSYYEITQRVTWPDYRRLQSSATVVLVASFLFAMAVGGADSLIERAMRFFYTLAR